MLKLRKKLSEKKEASRGIAKAGFTLIELIVVIAILGILVLLAAPRFLGYTRDANVATMQADAKVLGNGALIHNIENDASWPVDGEEGTLEVDGATITYESFDSDAMDDHVQTLSGDLGDYGLVTVDTEGVQVGDVVFVGNDGEGMEDRAGNTHFGTNLEVAAEAE